ncbi:hypothetical protein Tco_0528125 [Tanacetum coccineum]
MLDEKEGLKDLLFGVYQDGQVYRSKFLAGIFCGAMWCCYCGGYGGYCGGGGVLRCCYCGGSAVVLLLCGGGVVAVELLLRWWLCYDCVVVVVFLWMILCRQVESLPEETDIVPFTYDINGHDIQFGREEFCLATGLKFGVEYSECYLDGLMPFRRLLFQSDTDGTHITGDMLLDKIKSDLAVFVCFWSFKSVFHGKWLVVDLKEWDKYPWGSYVWPRLYQQLRNANVKRWDSFYVALKKPGTIAKYSLSGFTWAFKTYPLGAFKFYRCQDCYPRAVAWRNLNKLYQEFLPAFFDRARPNRRLRPNAVEAKADWCVSSRAFFDGVTCKPPPMPSPVNLHSRYVLRII